jgi:hypothetical protein
LLSFDTEPQPQRNRSGLTKRYGELMTREIEAMKLGAQQTLDELFAANLIPFRLSARVVEAIGMEEYIVRFHDSRLYSLDVSVQRDQQFKAVFRAALLDRVARLRVPPRLARTA